MLLCLDKLLERLRNISHVSTAVYHTGRQFSHTQQFVRQSSWSAGKGCTLLSPNFDYLDS